MPAFSAVNGSPPHASAWMLRDVLRGRLGFDGRGGERLDGDRGARAARRGAHDGRCGEARDPRGRGRRHGGRRVFGQPRRSTRARTPCFGSEIDEAVRRVLRAKYALGLFTDPYHGASEARAARVTLTAAHIAAARAAARESIVLLKNERATLPLSSRHQVARGDRRARRRCAELARPVVDRGRARAMR